MFTVSSQHPCEIKSIENCCNFTFGFSSNLEPLMKVMRFASNRGRRHFSLQSLPDKLMNQSKILKNIKDIPDPNAMIPKCYMKRYEADLEPLTPQCDLFQPTITDMGICTYQKHNETFIFLEFILSSL